MEYKGEVGRWRDPKRHLWMLGLIAPACSLLPSQLVLHTGLTIFWWIGPVIVFVAIPLIDLLVGDDGSNPPDEDYKRLSQDRYYRWCTYAFLPVQAIALLVAAYLWADPALSSIDKLGLAVTVGVGCGIGINAAHELGHRSDTLERWLSKVALAQSGYGHFFVEHNKGHHARVATPEDPASSRFGETLWHFLPRSIVGGLMSAITIERDRLHRRGSSWWSLQNNLLQAWAMTGVLFTVLLALFGWSILPYLLVQAAVGIGLLETVNYVEHYGLLREKLPDGRYERTSPRHSWNSDRLVTNVFLFHLQRHSDHHANPGRRYQTLRSNPDAPQLPAGYATMVLVAMIPALWRRVMDPRVLAHNGGDVTRCNIHPARREQILQRYAPHELSRAYAG